MGPFVWCAIGAALGFAASQMTGKGFVQMVESMAVGVFGAFLGGEFLPHFLLETQPGGPGVGGATIGMAVAGAVVCLMLLSVMRRAVGPMKPHLKKRRPS